jgi:hypothetical protein
MSILRQNIFNRVNVCWYMTLWNLVDLYYNSRGTNCLNLQGERIIYFLKIFSKKKICLIHVINFGIRFIYSPRLSIKIQQSY